MRFERTVMAGIGVCQRFTTARGQQAAVISHVNGQRDLVVYHPQDLDTALHTLVLAKGEAQAVAAVLDEAVTVDHVAELERRLPGVSVVRIPVSFDSPAGGRPFAGTGLAGQALALLAVVRDGTVVPTPGDGFVLHAGDEVVVAGTEAATSAAADLLAGG
ncbi:potassium transporter TrkA [Micromonospora peucetia]|uniref:Potassium transporter TrkA n=1 Tax=Micromonospora peucetia TaxID=47871 RepID=A0A1C6ULC5_9ACTN|nr:TrkA C-terminal domain-containing protein [Micromonospora peucetia]MCX4386984.1 potassium transporter TrkA [Micromonospora peucetia]WSA34354.1 potassium transporter TrkA [Micromonospora peucetia]SCL54856.1 TrkA domain protein [Micromonospora peucetia]